jgi:hypothetical protein
LECGALPPLLFLAFFVSRFEQRKRKTKCQASGRRIWISGIKRNEPKETKMAQRKPSGQDDTKCRFISAFWMKAGRGAWATKNKNRETKAAVKRRTPNEFSEAPSVKRF